MPPASAWEQVFEEAPRELLQLLHCYLLPTLESAAQGEQKATAHRTFRCLTRTFHRVVTDVLVVCDVAESADHAGIAVASSPDRVLDRLGDARVARLVRVAVRVQEPRTSNDDSPLDEAKPQPSNQQQQHLFDYIECRGAVPIPHGPREIHPTKAVYISSASVAASSASRRPSMAPTASSSTTSTTTSSSSSSSRHATSSSRAEYDEGGSGNGERRSGA
ncbi:hypothetical protein PINS_up021338 [Pythium insidiosum]|nr:hypothetical protein PINS_up021338 [Pythium insidiosum]